MSLALPRCFGEHCEYELRRLHHVRVGRAHRHDCSDGVSFHGDLWYEELKTWQDGIAAIIALAGLAVAALVGLDGVHRQIAANARNEQRKHEREQTIEKLRGAATLAGEVDAVVKAIKMEMQSLNNVLGRRGDNPANRRSIFKAGLRSAQRCLPALNAYEGLGHQIGVLGHSVVENAASFHTSLEAARRTYWAEFIDQVSEMSDEISEQWIET